MDGAFRSVGVEPGGVAPHELAVGASMDLVAINGELDITHVKGHLPEDKAIGLHSSQKAMVLHHLGGHLELGCHHLHLPHGIHVMDGALELEAS